LQHGAIINQTEVSLYAISLAQAKIEEASGKALDKASASDTSEAGPAITDSSQLTAPSSLGKEAGEYYNSETDNNFDDFDDYNAFSGNHPYAFFRQGVDSFYIQTTVYYVNPPPANPEVNAGTRTWHKRMVVKVWPTVTPWGGAHPKPDTVTMSYIQSYWWFR
jgi:hypothetical protein